MENVISQTGGYEIDGNTLALADDAEPDEEPSADEYCVTGDTLLVKSVDVDDETGAEQVFYYGATRQ
jgi:hypothetical protein